MASHTLIARQMEALSMQMQVLSTGQAQGNRCSMFKLLSVISMVRDMKMVSVSQRE